MHNADFLPSNTSLAVGDGSLVRVEFSNLQRTPPPPDQRNIGDLIRLKTANKEFFYGIELSARSFAPPDAPSTILDYRSFGDILPLFTSVIWLGMQYCNVEKIDDVDAVRFSQSLQPKTIVMPHFTCYRTDRKRLDNFLALNFTNVLALRGDQVTADQEYPHASDLVAEIRRIRGDSISIGVGGYPEGHPDSKSEQEDMEFLVNKVNSGADFIITQICFSAENLISFIERCRQNGITVPIMVGIYVPESWRTLQRMCEITQVQVPQVDMDVYEALQDKPDEFKKFAVQQAVKMIGKVFRRNINIYGVQFFSMNKFECVNLVVKELIAMAEEHVIN